MSPTTTDDHTLAYPEPPAHPNWHRHRRGPRPEPLAPGQQQRNRELLVLAQRKQKAA